MWSEAARLWVETLRRIVATNTGRSPRPVPSAVSAGSYPISVEHSPPSLDADWIWAETQPVHSGPDAAQNRQLAPKPNSTCDAAVVLFLLKIDWRIRWWHLFCPHIVRYTSKSRLYVRSARLVWMQHRTTRPCVVFADSLCLIPWDLWKLRDRT